MTAKAARNSRSKASVSLTLAAVARQATGTPSRSVAMWYLVPLLPRSVGLGPVRSPPRLARAKQVSRIRSRDQVGVAAQHADQQSMDFRQQTPLGPAPQAAAQGCATGLTRGGTQAAPGRALAQKAPQCRHNPDGLARRVAGSTAWPLVAGVDDRGDKMQKPEIHCCFPCLVSQTWAAAAQHPNQINSTLSSCENRSHGHLSVKGMVIGLPWHFQLMYPNGVQG